MIGRSLRSDLFILFYFLLQRIILLSHGVFRQLQKGDNADYDTQQYLSFELAPINSAIGAGLFVHSRRKINTEWK